MPTSYNDQFYLMNPSNPPPVGSALNFVNYTLIDANDDGDIDRFDSDSINGVDVVRSYPGDTVTINVPGVGNVTYSGTTFYMQGGGRMFTPTDGQVLQNGTFVSSTWVNGQGPLLVGDLGPPCFTPGTLIQVPEGTIAIDMLQPGDLVETLDRGPQPLRWIGQTRVDGSGAYAPIRVEEGVLGNSRPLLVSPQHRMLLAGWKAQLILGEPEILVPAKHLVVMDGIAPAPVAEVDYIHMLFDRHEIVFAEDAPSESFHPGSEMLDLDRALHAEIVSLFPELDGMSDAARLPARRVARAHEARLLAA